ncbi:MAG: hypothetical protein K0S07_1768 [Chlamydiales bacterium]|nr:hypothetical protein [Chlamydiales bacterium]
MFLNPVLVAFLNAFSSSALTLVNRYTLGVKRNNPYLVLLTNTFIPFLIGYFLLVMTGGRAHQLVLTYVTSYPCFLLALIFHLVSFTFSFAFKKWNVRQVVLQSKVADIVLSAIFFTTYLFKDPRGCSLLTVLCLVININACIPFFLMQKRSFLMHKTSLWVIVSLILQALFLSLGPIDKNITLEKAAALTIATFFWQAVFSSLLLMYKMQGGNKEDQEPDLSQVANVGALLLRPAAMLLTQATYIFSAKMGNPLLIWPIINSTPMISILMSCFFLREKLLWQDVFAMCGFTLSALLPLII